MLINKSKSIKNIHGGLSSKQNDYKVITNIHLELKISKNGLKIIKYNKNCSL
jgi:hypothetical protein